MNPCRTNGLLIIVVVVWSATSAPGLMAATVQGEVQRAENPQVPVVGARVTLFVPDLSFFREVRSDGLGRFSFTGIPEGRYRLGASARHLEYVEVDADVDESGLLFDFMLGSEVEEGIWEVIGSTLPEFLDATDICILMTDGNLLYCHDTTDPIGFNPVTGDKWFPTGSPSEQGCMNGSLLSDGRIIMVGGQEGSDPGSFRMAVRWVKAYDPTMDTWELLPDLQHPTGRWYAGLARLADGSFLVMGGGTRPNAERTETCERFDLKTQTWSYTGSMVNPCEFPPSALLFTGDVLATWWPPQLYDPVSGQWRSTGNFNQPNRSWPGHSDHSLVVLADGRALAIGVIKGPDNNTAMGEIYDPATETWSITSNPELIRFQTEVVQLPDGRILVAGGETEQLPPPVEDVLGIVKWCDLYDPGRDAWRRVADMNWFREYHGVTLLIPDGRVVTTGGTRIKFQYGPTSADIEAYVAPYLLRGVRPEIVGISYTRVARGSRLYLDIAPDTRLTNVVLMGMQTTTHWVAGGVPRRLVLPVEQLESIVRTSLPDNPNVLPLGYYMVFAMVDDIPSVAVIVQVTGEAEPQPGDADGDNDVDLNDYAVYLDCAAGPQTLPTPTPPNTVISCLDAFDIDADVDIDMGDFASLQGNFTGPG
ncbi:MAG: DUF1929 domain-containing protein [Planctomycetes bacterium]|nr:DUF1929 domain-containing protein [Planctomycetota bacterium]